MIINKSEINNFFRVGDIILSGGRRSSFRITKITDKNVRIQPTTAKTASRIVFDRLELVVQNFQEIDSNRIEHSVGEILRKNNNNDTQNESYIYGFAREYLFRSSKNLIEFNSNFQKNIIKSSQDGEEERRKRLKTSTKKPRRIYTLSYTFERNPDVVAEVLARAGGFCESKHCKKQAPFLRKSDGSPYLEVHHIKQLANGGEDTVENAIAICPNCHREAHYG